ncbi:MAG: serine/threonine protein kinase [Deltaproteobacteria bacterium]|nr:serine/threonine protein kinase [Deltaproteobacteria bacterium]
MVGRQLSRYRIVEEVGSGGMAVVYRGLDTSLDREVAVKVLHPHLAGKEESRKRFSREAQAVAKLHHPNILEIYDFSGAETAESFIITEFIRGQTLRQLAEKHPFKPPEVAAMAVHELANALEHAHAIGVIHRDIKPENVMIRDDGCLKLTDFGIAKILDRDEKMTLTGALVGSPAHMAPEIIEGDEAGPEADIFSLGTILYWLCVGKLPFFAANTTATLKKILDCDYEDPRIANAQVSDALAEVIAKCLAREPKARFATAGALRDALAALLKEAGIERPAEDLALFFADPEGGSRKLTTRIVEKRLEYARAQVSSGSPVRAMSALGQVLALEPGHPEALKLLDSLKRRARNRKRLAVVLSALGGVVVICGGAWAGVKAWNARPKPLPVVAQPEIAPPPVAEAPKPAPPPAPEPQPKVELASLAPDPSKTHAIARHDAAVKRPLKPGSVLIVPRPYADIFIDDNKVQTGAVQFLAELAAGKHRVRLEHAGTAPESIDVNVPEGGRAPDVRVRLQPLPGKLRVQNAQNAGVIIDGKLMGTAEMSLQNAFVVPMPQDANGQPAYHTNVKVTLTKPGFKDVTVPRTLQAGETVTLSQELEPQ